MFSGKIYIIPGTIKQGYLIKSPPLEKRGLKGWKKRWCMFTQASGEDPCLNYYHTEEEAYNTLPIKRVSLKDCRRVEIDLRHSNYKNIFAITLPERVYYFSASSQSEMCEWADTLCSHLQLTRNDLPAEVQKNKYSTLPADFGSPTQKQRPLPKPPSSPMSRCPNSPLPRIPTSPLPPIPREATPNSAPSPSSQYLSQSPKHHHHNTVAQHGNAMPSSSSGFSNSSPPPVPYRGSHTLPASTSPLLSRHPNHTPSPHSFARHSPGEPSHRGHRLSPPPVDSVDFRPPAPPPKMFEPDDFNLADDPPTPPPRKTTFSPPASNKEFFSSSDSDDNEAGCPQLPPRSPNLPPRSPNLSPRSPNLDIVSQNGFSP